MKGLYWGRFNPPHKGHIKLVKKILSEINSLIIAVGSARHKNTKRDPFDGKERAKMLKAYLKEEGFDMKKIKIVPVPNGKSMYSSVKNVFRLCPKFDVMYADKETIIKLVNKKVEIRKIKRTGKISSTKIRDAIAKDNKWENLTGKSTAKIIRKLNGIERIKESYGK
ncbi:nicotinamide-nucleotide adenylyltransferase [archaeon]|jgi:nicotinamide-nucleotide adenylyltransferase|nr:nicotinamide-nucleotide adenylyltransferase [archaeon]MBT6819927.1 nicotinamide-nucleotide adenylyltransferase [archaeon]MBT7025083.1 nicotinamide-nucleotide adenylyltransferase [archaeon]MBT7238344.1 nicotinamide-nucleotide adenylyltransferase [archaeon]MBT7568270.1 nicotinamide-nucleotide adenylyltransferase [archaeon]